MQQGQLRHEHIAIGRIPDPDPKPANAVATRATAIEPVQTAIATRLCWLERPARGLATTGQTQPIANFGSAAPTRFGDFGTAKKPTSHRPPATAFAAIARTGNAVV